jgi:hypothetical protein
VGFVGPAVGVLVGRTDGLLVGLLVGLAVGFFTACDTGPKSNPSSGSTVSRISDRSRKPSTAGTVWGRIELAISDDVEMLDPKVTNLSGPLVASIWPITIASIAITTKCQPTNMSWSL